MQKVPHFQKSFLPFFVSFLSFLASDFHSTKKEVCAQENIQGGRQSRSVMRGKERKKEIGPQRVFCVIWHNWHTIKLFPSNFPW